VTTALPILPVDHSKQRILERIVKGRFLEEIVGPARYGFEQPVAVFNRGGLAIVNWERKGFWVWHLPSLGSQSWQLRPRMRQVGQNDISAEFRVS
jgi:hypothetical protein